MARKKKKIADECIVDVCVYVKREVERKEGE